MRGAWRVLGFASALLLSGSARLAGQTTAPANATADEQQQPRTVELDFRYALQSPVLLYEFQDEGVTIVPRRNYAFLLAPFHYELTERRYTISTGVRVETEAGKRCRTLGIAVSDTGRSGGRFDRDPRAMGQQRPGMPSASPDETFQLSSQDQPLYERIQIESRGGEDILLWYNIRSPTPAPGSDGTRGSQRQQRRVAAPRGPGQQSDRRGEMPAGGFAALLIEYPEEASTLTVQFRGDPRQTIDLALISLVQASEDRSGQAWEDANELAALAHQVGRYAASGDAAMARLAVAWLAQVLNDYRPTSDPQQPDLAIPIIEAGLLAGVANPDPMAAQWAWSALSAREALSSVAIQFIAQQADLTVLKRLVSLIGQELADAGRQAGQDAVAGRRRMDRRPMRTGPQDVSLTVPSALPDSQASPACFAALQAILQSRHTDVVAEAVRLILTDATKQSIACLALLPPGAAQVALRELAAVTSEEVKTTAVKTMLLTPSPETLKQIIETEAGWTLTISDPQDPLLAQPIQTSDRQKRITILRLLQNADMQGVLDSQEFRDLIEGLTGALATSDVRREAYLLLARQWLKAGGASAPAQSFDRADRSGRGGRSLGGGSLEQLLLEALAQPDKDVQKEAVAALLKTGHVLPVIDQLSTRVPATQVASLLNALGADPELRLHADTLTLLGAMLGHSDPNIGREAMSVIHKAFADSSYPERERWRMRLAVKRNLSLDGLTQRLGDSNTDIAKMAAAVASRLSSVEVPPGDAKKAGEQLRKIDAARAADPSGTYHLLVTGVVSKPDFEWADVPGRSGVKELKQLRWLQVRATASGMVTISRQAEAIYAVTWNGKAIGSMGGVSSASDEQAGGRDRSGRGRTGRSRQQVQEGPMRIDTAELVKQALNEVSAVAGTTRVPSPLAVGLRHVILGMWEGSWQSPQDQRAAIDYERQQYRVDAQGRVILGQIPEPHIQEVSAWLELQSN